MQIRFFNIVWDLDEGDNPELPTDTILTVSDDLDVAEYGADALSDHYGWCVRSFAFVEHHDIHQYEVAERVRARNAEEQDVGLATVVRVDDREVTADSIIHIQFDAGLTIEEVLPAYLDPARPIQVALSVNDGQDATDYGIGTVQIEAKDEAHACALIDQWWGEWREEVEHPDADSQFIDWLIEHRGGRRATPITQHTIRS